MPCSAGTGVFPIASATIRKTPCPAPQPAPGGFPIAKATGPAPPRAPFPIATRQAQLLCRLLGFPMATATGPGPLPAPGGFPIFPARALLFRWLHYFEKASAAVQNEMELLHMKYQHVLDSLLDQFSDRFSQFRSLEQTMKIIKYPDVVVYSSLELNGFQWMQIDDLEMQLAEFQDSIWAQVFVNLRSKLENLERCHLENQRSATTNRKFGVPGTDYQTLLAP
ncbi:hypothetical protein QTO34_014370 [Cnephaeus nilssonii]|uniref:Uncharacterized protein n=1 Tax=Cnephaeus nilssonii TaxID=3371016 RepID=A0AA40LU05_CNENI|nr:hypothetical protein QTO34_014370 [Eptesicus nilssonii]